MHELGSIGSRGSCFAGGLGFELWVSFAERTRSARAHARACAERVPCSKRASAAQRQRQRQLLRCAASRVRASDFVLCSVACGWWVRVRSFWRCSECRFGLCEWLCISVLSTLVGAGRGSGGARHKGACRLSRWWRTDPHAFEETRSGCRSSGGWWFRATRLRTGPRRPSSEEKLRTQSK